MSEVGIKQMLEKLVKDTKKDFDPADQGIYSDKVRNHFAGTFFKKEGVRK